jgi:hypothetical protein
MVWRLHLTMRTDVGYALVAVGFALQIEPFQPAQEYGPPGNACFRKPEITVSCRVGLNVENHR